MSHLRKILAAIILVVTGFCCSPSRNLDSWIGTYQYEEQPIEALAGYSMVMLWEVSLNQTSDGYQAKIEINGQQTYLVLLARIFGDTQKVDFLFDKGLDGIGYEAFQKGDTLFSLRRQGGRIVTHWDRLAPRLREDYVNDCVCFVPNKRTDDR